MAKDYDVVILGGGTGGYVAAIRASQLGLKTAIVEKNKMGGTCLHAGCIPTKALLRSAEVYVQSKKALDFGVEVNDVKIDFERVQQRKSSVVDKLYKGVQHLMKKGKIDVYDGFGRILGPSIFSPMPGTISVEMNDGTENEMLVPQNVIVATGSRPRTLDGLKVDGKKVFTSDEFLTIEKLPKSAIIIGGGVIGVEWASMLTDFDVEVTIIELGDRLLPTEDAAISAEMLKSLKKRGVNVHFNVTLDPSAIDTKENVSLQVNDETISAEALLLSVGRVANTANIGLENTEIELNNGYISVNEHFQTKERHIYAIGDVIGGMQLAHVASHEGIRAVEHIAGQNSIPLHYANIARGVYSNPEVASVGLTEEQAKNNGYKVVTTTFPFKAIGKAIVYGETAGFVKVVADESSNDVVGVHLIGPHATDLISEAALGLFLNASPWEVGQMVHLHPSLSEIIGEAALAIEGKAIHF
ncbi:dihydrolipoamide dehydrogenase [Solibacillus kalamii]|uniref:Dihydrolipoyl dehydrogenase n=1 Tax=Solibacillus kalamii TaxID=1748298 RepID=A0ABX3ZKA7_9BACL|nr:dihydrolipoyl dehydrogenase [Solibacillus kalamii]MBM7664175.1 dihydrolipoamide dehydrogenase [Solibacillus kalamii]OUZ40059.1 dihydrolipoyl dehydrogenase [Solibacillus kalamii]